MGLIWAGRDYQKAISAMYTISFAALIIIGTLSMAYADFTLGSILFSLGIVLMIGNEYIIARQAKKQPRYLSDLLFSPETLSEMINFAFVAYLLPATMAIFLYFLGDGSPRVLVVVFAGMIATGIKIAAKTVQFLMAK